eukprot:Rmarinus@m.17542
MAEDNAANVACSVKVLCRFRPLVDREKEELSDLLSGDDEAMRICLTDDRHVSVVSPIFGAETWTFDRIFDEQSKQEDVFNTGARPGTQDVVDGYNATIFAYGQTGAGKTYTMLGEDIADDGQMGIIPRVTRFLFDCIEKKSGDAEDDLTQYTITCSYLEIYNERINDLLDSTNTNLTVRESKTQGVFVADLTERRAGSVEDITSMLEEGSQVRATAATKMNEHSSRSHSLFTIRIDQVLKDGSTMKGRMNLIDLAGSEKVAKTGARGQTLEEAKKINQSLSALGKCINALSDPKKNSHIPFRDSKLTRILQESLGGNTKTTLIICCTPCKTNIEETLSTLRFGSRAKTIETTVKVNVDRSPLELKSLISRLRKELSREAARTKEIESKLKEEQDAAERARRMQRHSEHSIDNLVRERAAELLPREEGLLFRENESLKARVLELQATVQREKNMYQAKISELENELESAKLECVALKEALGVLGDDSTASKTVEGARDAARLQQLEAAMHQMSETNAKLMAENEKLHSSLREMSALQQPPPSPVVPPLSPAPRPKRIQSADSLSLDDYDSDSPASAKQTATMGMPASARAFESVEIKTDDEPPTPPATSTPTTTAPSTPSAGAPPSPSEDKKDKIKADKAEQRRIKRKALAHGWVRFDSASCSSPEAWMGDVSGKWVYGLLDPFEVHLFNDDTCKLEKGVIRIDSYKDESKSFIIKLPSGGDVQLQCKLSSEHAGWLDGLAVAVEKGDGKLQVRLPFGGKVLTIQLPDEHQRPSVQWVLDRLSAALSIPRVSMFRLVSVTVNLKTDEVLRERILRSDEGAFDTILQWKRQDRQQRDRDSYQYDVIFQKVLFFPDDDKLQDAVERQFEYDQAVNDVIMGYIDVGTQTFLLGAMQLQVVLASLPKDNQVKAETMLDQRIESFLPRDYFRVSSRSKLLKKKRKWIRDILAIHAEVQSDDALTAQQKYLNTLRTWRLYGTALFPAETLSLNTGLPSSILVGVNRDGFCIIKRKDKRRPKDKDVLLTYSVDEIHRWGHNESKFQVSTVNPDPSKPATKYYGILLFLTAQGDEICEMIDKYACKMVSIYESELRRKMVTA